MDFVLTTDERGALLDLAVWAVNTTIREHKRPALPCPYPKLYEKGAAFVTLTAADELRGCIGQVEAHVPLWDCVREMAIAAATQDPRFAPVQIDELPGLSFEITMLTPLECVEDPSTIVVGRDGLMIERGGARGLLLPQVPVEWGWDRETFLGHVARKAGLPADAWRDPRAKLYRFEGLIFGRSASEVARDTP